MRDVAPVAQVIGDHGQAVPPGFHDGFHVMEAGILSDDGRCKALADLGSFLELPDLLGSLYAKDNDRSSLSFVLFNDT